MVYNILKGADLRVCSFFCLGLDGCIDDVCLGLFRNGLERYNVEITVCVLNEFECDKVSLNGLYWGITAPIAHPKCNHITKNIRAYNCSDVCFLHLKKLSDIETSKVFTVVDITKLVAGKACVANDSLLVIV